MSSHYLFTPLGRLTLLSEYVEKERSAVEIAEEWFTYPKLVIRALRHHGLEVRERGRAQAVALKKGRARHPTKGRARREEEKEKIRRKLKRQLDTDTKTTDNFGREDAEEKETA